ncbi:hypothetical protein BpHYR1_040885 [Brachionus plicatilis]|uniref:Uncharacterized protein n=1 Tax=Brachionus plicatilis TaxID=10195 RepID=A0A3M7RSM1_BRAPC|nr:hypothetical protein BpHYR1_040885 [Brachionus plicatilis]
MVFNKMWLISHAKFFEHNQFKKIEADIVRQFLNFSFDDIKRSLLASNVIREDGELSVVYVQSKLATFYKDMLAWIKKHKKISKNLHFVKEVENADLKSIYEVYKHLSHHENSKSGFEIILTQYHLNKHYEVVKQFRGFNMEMIILIYTYSLLVFIMCLYIIFLFFLLYF